jgi:hypothetical protein
MKKLLLFYLILSAGHISRAQVEKLILPSDLKQQTIVTEPVTLRKGFVRAETNITFNASDKYFNDSRKKEYYIGSSWGSRYQYNFNLQYGISDRIEIDVYIPFVNQRNDYYFVSRMPVANQDASISSDLRGRALGDCSLFFRYQVIPEKEKRTSLSIFSEIYFPTGPKNPTDIKDFNDYHLPTGTGHYSAGLWLYANWIHYPYSYTIIGNYYYNFRGSKRMSADDAVETKFKNGNMARLGGRFNCHLNEWIVLVNEVSGFYYSKGEENNGTIVTIDPAWEIDYVPRLVFQVRRFRIVEFVEVPLIGKDIGADPIYSLSVGYTF